MKKHFVFCHGFGFDKSFWKNLAPYFSKEKCTYLDLGYFDNKLELEAKNDNTQLVGIGHSLGLTKLLNLNRKFTYLVGINSFTNFLGNDSALNEYRSKELKRLMNNFVKSPINTMKNFYQRCGIPMNTQKIEKINEQMVLNDLEFLSKTFCIPSEVPTLIIGTKDDVIVPSTVLRDNFKEHSNVILQIMNQGNHGLGYFKADEIHKRIMIFINDTV